NTILPNEITAICLFCIPHAHASIFHRMASTGPNSLRGKPVSRRSAWKHGILSEIMAIHPFEDQREWATFRDGVSDSLDPEGYLEPLLVERIAIAFWKPRPLQ